MIMAPGTQSAWRARPLGDLLRYEQPGRYLVRSTNYAPRGRYPVLTAGKTFVLGYTNEPDGAYTHHPVIIFDDFTTASKYVDFDFKAKSSAMKMLTARNGEADLRFVYERMQLIDYPIFDHKRRWIAEFSKIEVDVPQLDEQTAIAEVATELSAYIASLESLFAKKSAIKQGMLQRVFALPEEGNQRAALGSLVGMLSGGTPDRSNEAYWSGSIPWISATTLKNLEVDSSDQAVTEMAVRVGSKMAPLHSTLVLVRGSALHSEIRASLVTAPVCFNQDVKALVPAAKLEPKFLTYSIHANASRLLRLVTSAGNTAGVLDTKVLKDFEIWLPDRPRQRAVVAIIDDVTAEIDTLRLRIAKARAIKTGMMQQLLTGRTRLPVEATS